MKVLETEQAAPLQRALQKPESAPPAHVRRALPPPIGGSFRLLRYFSLASLVVVVAAAVLLTMMYSWKAEQALLLQGEQKNAAQLRLILNHLIDAERGVVNELLASRTAPPVDGPAVRHMAEIATKSVSGTTVVKLKLYNLAGLTVFSTELKQVGEDKAGYPGFVTAAAGAAASQLSHRESFESIGGTVRQVDVIGSYLPVRDVGGRTIGVVEIYDNVTLLARDIANTRWQIMGLSALLLSVLYLALIAIVRRADSTLKLHERVLEMEVRQRGRLADELQDSLKLAESAQRATERANAFVHAARRDAESASAAKTEFLYAVVETMRTPINSVIGLIDVLSSNELTEVQRSQVKVIRDQALTMLELLDEHLRKSEAAPRRA